MKTPSLILLGVLAACGGGQAASKAGAAPPAAPSPPAASVAVDEAPRTDGDITEARVHGVHVLVKHIPGAELVAGHLFVRGGVRNWGKRDAGIEALLVLASAAGGTEKLERDAFNVRLAELGSTIFGRALNDYSVYAAKALTPNWDATFELLVDVFLRPALPAAEIEHQRTLMESQLKHEQELPDARLDFLARQSLFKGHPYENRPVGTVETVAGLGRDALVAHLGKLRETSRLVLVVVGDVDPAHVIGAVHELFDQVPVGSYVESPLPPLVAGEARVAMTEQKLPTNYIHAAFSAPGLGDPEYATARVAILVLGQREFEEVRTKRNLSYAPGARYFDRTGMPFGFLYVSAVDPKTTMKVMLDEARRLREEPVGAEELAGNKSMLLTAFFLENETTDAQAQFLGDAQILGGDWHLLRTLSDRVKAVTAADIQAFARKRLTRLQTVVLGDPKTVDEGILKSL